MAKLIVLYDACVLYPAPLRDFLMHLALLDLFCARWTDQIHEEWIRSVLNHRKDITREQLERTRMLMNSNVLDCLVTGYESLIKKLILPDPDDRHVLAASIKSKASIIVTFNRSDFPDDYLKAFGIKAQHPDEFIKELLHLDSTLVCNAAKRQRESLKNPPKTVDEYLESLSKQHLPKTVRCFQQFKHLL